MSIKDKEKNKKENLIQEAKNSEIYRALLKKFPDAELLDFKLKKKEED